MKLTKHFDSVEFECPCCGKAEMDEGFISKLETLRVTINQPIKVNSGFRCSKHNKAIGGKRNSAHLLGKAVDIQVANSHTRYLIIQHGMNIGITRYGIGKNFIHLDYADESTGHPTYAIWHYYS